MFDTSRAAREDLAFLRGLAEDKGPLPSYFGAQLIAPGLIYGANLIYIWLALKGYAWWPKAWMGLAWVPGAALYLPLLLVFARRNRGRWSGPAARVTGAAWAAVAMMAVSVIAVTVVATLADGVNHVVIWPPVAFVLYGGAWTLMGLMRKSLWQLSVAAACLTVAIAAAAVASADELWLVTGIGLLIVFVGPGMVILRPRRR